VLEFEEEGHVYRWEGEIVPSVTQVLDAHLSSYEGVPRHILEAAGEKGTIVHRMCELHDNGNLGEYPDEYDGYLQAWIQFCEVYEVEVEISEHRLFHRKLMYAGTPDRILTCKPPKKRKRIRALVDIKSWTKHIATVGPQTGAYEKMWDQFIESDPDMKIDERWAVRLGVDGKFYVTPLRDRNDFAIFSNCLTLWKWSQKNL